METENEFRNYLMEQLTAQSQHGRFSKDYVAEKLTIMCNQVTRLNVDYTPFKSLDSDSTLSTQLFEQMSQPEARLPEVTSSEDIPFKQIYDSNDNVYLIVAKDAEKYMAMLNMLINGKQDIIPMSDENKKYYQKCVVLLNKLMVYALQKHAYVQIEKFRDNFRTLFVQGQQQTDFYQNMKSYLVDQCNDELQKLERASKLKFRTEYVNILYEIEFCAFIFRG